MEVYFETDMGRNPTRIRISRYLRHEDNFENWGSFPVDLQELYYIPIESTPKYKNFIVESHGHNTSFFKK